MFPISLLKRSQKREISFSYNTFPFRFLERKNFFQDYIVIELKTFFIIFKEQIEWQKYNIAIITIKQVFIKGR